MQFIAVAVLLNVGFARAQRADDAPPDFLFAPQQYNIRAYPQELPGSSPAAVHLRLADLTQFFRPSVWSSMANTFFGAPPACAPNVTTTTSTSPPSMEGLRRAPFIPITLVNETTSTTTTTTTTTPLPTTTTPLPTTATTTTSPPPIIRLGETLILYAVRPEEEETTTPAVHQILVTHPFTGKLHFRTPHGAVTVPSSRLPIVQSGIGQQTLVLPGLSRYRLLDIRPPNVITAPGGAPHYNETTAA